MGAEVGLKALTLAVAPAAEGHPSDDHKERCGRSRYSSHNAEGGEQICRE